jgi:LysM repeat protein
MLRFRKTMMIAIAVMILIGGTGFTAQPAAAAGCTTYHTVRWGESLSWIGRYYNVSWPYLAQINGIGWPYRIYAGQVLCIAGGGSGGVHPGWTPIYYQQPVIPWSFIVTNVVQNTTVTIQTANLPSNVLIHIKMGYRAGGGAINWVDVQDVSSDAGGTVTYDVPIPAAFANQTPLVIRLVQDKKNGTSFFQDQWFNNTTGSGGPGPGPGTGPGYTCPGCYYYWGIPTIWIVGVVRDSQVTFQTQNYPPNVNFDVFMGPMGTAGHGIFVGSFNSGSGGSFQQTFAIPGALYGAPQISIRAQSPGTGFYSYNWFFNNTTP